jgi:peptide/nickel transport system substrate-binding protein
MIARRLLALTAALAAAAGLAACGRALPTAAQLGGGASSSAVAASSLSPDTAPPTRDVTKPIVWATYRMVDTLDPVQAFDYPENTVDTALCDSLLRQQPDGTIVSGLATATYPDATTLVLNLRSGPRFWDGHPVTAADVVYSLDRAAHSKLSFYGQVFDRVRSIRAVSSSEVVIQLTKPDYWLTGELSQMAGIVYERAYAQREGKKFGTPQGLTMCSGPYEVKQWIPGEELVATANPHYWDSTEQPKVHEIIFKGIGDDASLTSGLETGAVNGTYPAGLSTYDQLKRDKNLTVTNGPSIGVDAMVIDNLTGVLGNVKVRQALSDAINRTALIEANYHGAAQLPRTLENPGQWGYGQSVFEEAWDKLPVPKVNLAKARALIKTAGAAGKSITIGTTQQITSLATDANVVRQAGEEIGLKVTIKSVSAQDYIAYFESAAARKGIDMFPTSNYGDYADPAAYFNTVVMPGASQNFDDYSDPAMTRDLDLARSTADPDRRAQFVARVGTLFATQLPWIPLDDPDTTVITSRDLTGEPASFTYMGGPWANLMGGR